MKEKPDNPLEMEYTFHLISVIRSTGNDQVDKQATESHEQEPPKMFLKLMTTIEFDTFTVTHGQGTSVESKSNIPFKNSKLIFLFFRQFT